MPDIKRIEKGSESPEYAGQGDKFLIPRDILPEGLKSGESVKIVLEGDISIDEQGGVITLERLYCENPHSREDPLQSSMEKGLKEEMAKNEITVTIKK